MRFRRSLAPLALLLSATSFTTPALAAPALAASRYLTGPDLFGPEAATDPQISPDGRHIAYVRQSNDIMTDQARARSGWSTSPAAQQPPLVAGAGIILRRRAGRPTARAWPMSAADGGSPQLFVRWMATGAERAHHRTAAQPGQHRLVAGRQDASPSRCSCPTRAQARHGAAPSPRARNGPSPLKVIDAVTYRADGAGYLKPGYQQSSLVPADGGAPTPAHLRRSSTPAARSAGLRDGRVGPVRRQPRADWEREPSESEIYRVGIDGGAPARAHHATAPTTRRSCRPMARRSPTSASTTRSRGYAELAALCDGPSTATTPRR